MKKNILLIALAGLSFVSCRLDNNIDPNNPKAETSDARTRLAAAETTTYEVQAINMNQLGNIFMNSWAGNIYYFGNPLTKETNLNIDTSFYQNIWNFTYLRVGYLQAIIDAPSSQALPLHKAIAKILKAHYMQYIVDLYNDVPYSEAFGRTNNFSPKYDKAQDVYKALVLELNDAIKIIDANSNPTADLKVLPSEDVMFGGNMATWKKFANTVKLRYLVRQSKTTDAAAKAFVQEQLPTLQGASFMDTDAKIQPGYSAATTDNQNPLYKGFGEFLSDGSRNTQGWRLFKASDYMAKALNGDVGAVSEGVVDPRGSKLFSPVAGKISGVVQGSLKQTGKKESDFSYLGGFLRKPVSEGSAMDGYVMLLAESELLQAEAAIVYPQYFSNAQSHFEKGISASFAFHGIPDQAAAYIAAIDKKAGAGWTATADKMEAIQYQRWIALTNVNGIESYLGYLKTGYPNVPLAVNAQKTRKPYRLLYPQTEYTNNSKNVPVMTNDEAFSLNQFTPFWLK